MTIWNLTYSTWDPQEQALREALCTVGNGFFATRGALPWSCADDVHYPGTYAAGLFDRLATQVADRQVENEDLVNLPNWLPLSWRVVEDRRGERGDDDGGDSGDGGERQGGDGGDADRESGVGHASTTVDPDAAWNAGWFDPDDMDVVGHFQQLDLRQGVLTTQTRVRDGDGRTTLVTTRRLVSMAHRHICGVEMTVVPEDWSGRIELRSALDGRVTNSGVPRYRDLRGDHLLPQDEEVTGEDTVLLRVVTRQSRILIAEGARTRYFLDEDRIWPDVTPQTADALCVVDTAVDVEQGQQLRVEKLVSLFTSRDRAITEPGEEACRRLEVAGTFEEMLEDHVLAWKQLWDANSLTFQPAGRAQMVLNLHIFHLLQTVSPNTIDVDASVPARGLHGEAYRGHIFWDEMFILPYLSLREPELTRSLLLYRYRRLPEARRLAAAEGHDGATFPWQSGSDGREESQSWHLNPESGNWIPDNSHLQRHINIAVAYCIWTYYECTGDHEFLTLHGAEILLEVARFFVSVATYNHALDRFEIKGVMGPDEYHEAYPWRDEPGLDNNTYTNVMSVWVILRALEAVNIMPARRRMELLARLRLGEDEFVHWERVTRKMRIVMDEQGIMAQFEHFEKLEEFDWQRYREKYGDIARLDRILEAEGDTPNRYQVSKQADVLMLFYLLSSDEVESLIRRLDYPWDPGFIDRNIEYHRQRTSHGSTLSSVVHSWVLSQVHSDQSYDFFQQALESDIADVQGGTTPEGIHLGAMAGTVDMVQRGYTGMRAHGDVLILDPHLPEQVEALSFTIRYRGAWDVRFDIDHRHIEVHTPANSTIKVGYRGEVTEIGPSSSAWIDLADGHVSREGSG